MRTPLLQAQWRQALRRSSKLRRRPTAAHTPMPPRMSVPEAVPAPWRWSWRFVSVVASGFWIGLGASALVLWGLQVFLPRGQYAERIQIPLATHWGLVQREAFGWVSDAEALYQTDRPAEAVRAYALAVSLLDLRLEPSNRALKNQIQGQIDAIELVKTDIAPLVRPSWGSLLWQLAGDPLQMGAWLDALVAYPLIQEPQLTVLLVLSLWLALSFVAALQDQMAWTRILDQERPFSLGRTLPPALGGILFALLMTALFTLSPSQPVMAAVVCGAAVPGLFVQILNRAYQLRSRQALVAWETQHRAEFSSELHNTAQQSIMNAQVVLREIILDLEVRDEPEAGHYAWRLAEAIERCQEVEDELRVLRNGTEDKFARGQTFADAIEPICDRLDRRDVQYRLEWLREGQSVEAHEWEPWAFALAESARDRRIAATLYQVLSELTWNVIKYARLDRTEPVRVDIEIACSRRRQLVRYRLVVKDNGPGFDLQSAQSRRPHSGIFSLERYLRRVEIVGAEAHSTLQTAPGQGTQVITEIVVVPQRR